MIRHVFHGFLSESEISVNHTISLLDRPGWATNDSGRSQQRAGVRGDIEMHIMTLSKNALRKTNYQHITKNRDKM